MCITQECLCSTAYSEKAIIFDIFSIIKCPDYKRDYERLLMHCPDQKHTGLCFA